MSRYLGLPSDRSKLRSGCAIPHTCAYSLSCSPLCFASEVLILQWTEEPALAWQCVELFSGVGNISLAFRQANKTVANFDRANGGRAMDITLCAGFLWGDPNCKTNDRCHLYWIHFLRIQIMQWCHQITKMSSPAL